MNEVTRILASTTAESGKQITLSDGRALLFAHADAGNMPRIEIPTEAGLFVLEFVEPLLGADVWRVEGRRDGRGTAQSLYVRVLPPLTVEQRVRRWERFVTKAKRDGLPIPPKPDWVAAFQIERERAAYLERQRGAAMPEDGNGAPRNA